MHTISKKHIKSKLLAFLPGLFLLFSSCSNLQRNPSATSSVTFRINASRTALLQYSECFIDVTLTASKGSYDKTQTQAFKTDGENGAGSEDGQSGRLSFNFDKVPVGAEVYAQAKIYYLYDDEKCMIYEGRSESQPVLEEGTSLSIKLDTIYNSITETSNAYIVNRPLFTIERSKEELTNNLLEFKNSSDVNNCNESFRWGFDELGDYQKAEITFRGDKLNADAQNVLRFKFIKGSTEASYYQDALTVQAGKNTATYMIPQGIKLTALGLENSWNTDAETWAADLSCYIDRIIFFKDTSLLDPDFNLVTKTDYTYTVKNPALQTIAYTNIKKNIVEFDSLQGVYNNDGPYSAAYWEFADIEDYDKATIKVRCQIANDTGMRFTVKGYSPFNYPEKQTCENSAFVEANLITIPEISQSYTFSINLEDLKKTDDNKTISIQAIEFENSSYTGEYDTGIFGDKWSFAVEEIKLLKNSSSGIDIGVEEPDSTDISVTQDSSSQSGKIIFTAPADYTSYVWKVNGEVQTNYTGNIFIFDKEKLADGQTNRPAGVYDISLLADSHSWSTQVTIN